MPYAARRLLDAEQAYASRLRAAAAIAALP
jgi:hypothetical protein